MKFTVSVVLGWVLLVVWGTFVGSVRAEGRLWRRPVALALSDDGGRLFIANRESGTVSVVDVDGLKVAGETEVGRKLSDMVSVLGRLLVVDEEDHSLLILDQAGLRRMQKLKVAPYPVNVEAGGGRCFVASLWSRRVTVVGLEGEPRVIRSINLPFAPREQLLVRDATKLLVADSFGGRVAVVDVETGKEELVRGMRFLGVEARSMKRILAAGAKRAVYNSMGSVGSSIIAPAVVFEELELTKVEAEFDKLPILVPPAQRK